MKQSRWSRRAALVVVVALLGTIQAWFGASTPASATPSTLQLTCATAGSQINGLFPQWNYTGMSTTAGVTGPATIAPGADFTLTYDLSAMLDLHRFIVWAGNYWHITQIGNGVYLRFTLPNNVTFKSWSAASGGNMAITNVYPQGNTLVIHTNTAVQNTATWTQGLDLPDVNVTYTAGSSGQVTIRPGGSVAAPGNDPAQAPFLHMAISPNSYWTTPDPQGTPPPPVPFPNVDQLTQITEYCQADNLPVLFTAPIAAPSPQVVIATPTAGASLPQAPPSTAQFGTVDCIAPPAGASCEARIDGGAWFAVPDTSHPLNAVAGPHTFSARMVDSAGQAISGVASASAPYTVTAAPAPDQVPPTVTITSPSNGATLTVGQAPTPTYQFACSDASPGVLASCVGEYAGSVNGPWTAIANGGPIPLNLVGGNPTHYVVRVKATDQAGNTATKVHSYTVLPGAVPQTGGFTCTGGIKVVAIGGGAPWNGSNCVPFTANAAPLQTGEGIPYTWSSALGQQTLTNGVGAKVTYTFAATGGTFSVPTLTGAGAGVAGATATVSPGGAVVLSFTLTSATFTPPPLAVTVTPTGAIGQSVIVRFTRVAAGAQQLPPSWVPPPPVPALATTLIVAAPDVTPPAIVYPSPAHGSVWTPGTPIPVTYSCTDGVAPAQNCTTVPAGIANGSTLTPPAGTYTLAVQSIDAAGNVAFEEHTYIVGTPISTVSIAGCAVTEAAPCEFLVSISPPVSAATTVDLSVLTGTASLDDFTPPATMVVVPANTASVSVAVPTTDDAVVETTEEFTIGIVSSSGQVVISSSSSTATGTIADWNTTHQCHARWPVIDIDQINLALTQLPGGTGTVNDLVALGLTYWQADLSGLSGPIDPGYFLALPPADPSDVIFPVSFTQAMYNSLVLPLMQLNGKTCDEVATLALFLGAVNAGARPGGNDAVDVRAGGRVGGGANEGASPWCRLDERLCAGSDSISKDYQRLAFSMRTVLTQGRPRDRR